ncbi:hypothetical protein A2U01_0070977, partial [Trifolium medium]|nr:hypothetical protein [Trifolium medium]
KMNFLVWSRRGARPPSREAQPACVMMQIVLLAARGASPWALGASAGYKSCCFIFLQLPR